jgi:hypothetical protein
VVHTDAAPETLLHVDRRSPIDLPQRIELAQFYAFSARDAESMVDDIDKPGRREHWRSVLMRLNRAATARAAIADGVESIEGGILEECMVDMAPCVFGPEDLHRLSLRDTARASRMVLEREAGEWFTDDEAHIEREAGVLAGGAAGAFEHDDLIGILQDDIPRPGIRDHLLQVHPWDRFLDGHKPPSCLERHDLSVVRVGECAPGG